MRRYRVVVYAGEVYDVYYRQAATVEGDGELSLKELHEARNRDRVGRKPKNNNYAVWPSKIEYGWIEDKYGYARLSSTRAKRVQRKELREQLERAYI
jgi:hypothetical protein